MNSGGWNYRPARLCEPQGFDLVLVRGSWSRALGNFIQKRETLLNDFLIKATARGSNFALDRTALGPGRPRVPAVGNWLCRPNHSLIGVEAGNWECGTPRLFREATQRKTVGVAVRAAGVEVLRIEMQVQTVEVIRGRRPAEPVVADAEQRAIRVKAVARGGPK